MDTPLFTMWNRGQESWNRGQESWNRGHRGHRGLDNGIVDTESWNRGQIVDKSWTNHGIVNIIINIPPLS